VHAGKEWGSQVLSADVAPFFVLCTGILISMIAPLITRQLAKKL
jgi:hypothetical protein